MKSLIDFKEVEDIFKQHRNKYVGAFCDYKWSSSVSIDDVIYLAKMTKELETIYGEIKNTPPSGEDYVKVTNAVMAIAGHAPEDSQLYKDLKTIADFLGLELPKYDSKDNKE